MFGVTRKKAGWDCMRHLEIMAAGCIPYFTDLDSLPRLTMQFYPKKLFAEAKALKGVTFQGEDTDPKSFNVDLNVLNFDKYYELATRILEHSRRHLTTSAMARYLLRTVSKGVFQPNRVLMATNCIDDYLTDTILHGLKKVLRQNFTDFVPEARRIPAQHCVNDLSSPAERLPSYRLNMYMDSWAARSAENFQSRVGYGKGFTVWNRLSKLLDGNVDRHNIYERLRAGKFDLVILSDRLLRQPEQQTFVEHVRSFVPRDRIVILLGGDLPVGIDELRSFSAIASWLFEREIYE